MLSRSVLLFVIFILPYLPCYGTQEVGIVISISGKPTITRVISTDKGIKKSKALTSDISTDKGIKKSKALTSDFSTDKGVKKSKALAREVSTDKAIKKSKTFPISVGDILYNDDVILTSKNASIKYLIISDKDVKKIHEVKPLRKFVINSSLGAHKGLSVLAEKSLKDYTLRSGFSVGDNALLPSYTVLESPLDIELNWKKIAGKNAPDGNINISGKNTMQYYDNKSRVEFTLLNNSLRGYNWKLQLKSGEQYQGVIELLNEVQQTQAKKEIAIANQINDDIVRAIHQSLVLIKYGLFRRASQLLIEKHAKYQERVLLELAKRVDMHLGTPVKIAKFQYK